MAAENVLQHNGYLLQVEDEEIVAFFLSIARGDETEVSVMEWIEDHMIENNDIE